MLENFYKMIADIYKSFTVKQALPLFIIHSFNLHNNPLKYESLSPFYKWKKWGLEDISNKKLPKVIPSKKLELEFEFTQHCHRTCILN